MGVYLRIKKSTDKMLSIIRAFAAKKGEKKNIKKKKHLINKVVLTKEQKQKIDVFFRENYGKKIKYHWHRLYQSYTGIFNERYFPEILFSTKLEELLCPIETSTVFEDKNLLPQLFGSVDVHIPKTYFSSINGLLRNNKNELCDLSTVCLEMANKTCVIKKSIETSSGRDVFVCDFKNGVDQKNNLTIEEIITSLGKDFIIQEKLSQSVELSTIYSKSVNTFRVMTYIVESNIYCAPIALRLARGGADRDNIHYGGITVGVNDDGTLFPKAFSEFGECYESHPDTGIKFEGYKFTFVDKLKETAKKLHACIPQLGIISWDLSVDKNNEICLIEANTGVGQSVWFPQMIQGKAIFGEHTEYMLKLISKK